MGRIKILDLAEKIKVSREQMKTTMGGYCDKVIMLGSGIPRNPFGWDTSGDSSGSSTGHGQTSGTTDPFPDVSTTPSAGGPVPTPYPNIQKTKN